MPFGFSVDIREICWLEVFLPETDYKVPCCCFLGNLKFRTNVANLICVFLNSCLC